MLWFIICIFFIFCSVIGFIFIENKKKYLSRIAETFSQWLNVVHGGNSNDTFSYSVAQHKDSSNWYWKSWVWVFTKFFPSHLERALEPDGDNEI